MRARIQLTHACAWHAAGRQAHDVDNDGKLDFNEFCALVKEREMAEHSNMHPMHMYTCASSHVHGMCTRVHPPDPRMCMACIQEREMAEHTEEELRARFEALDGDNSGLVHLRERPPHAPTRPRPKRARARSVPPAHRSGRGTVCAVRLGCDAAARQVDMYEYIRWSLRDALSRSSSRVIDLFKQARAWACSRVHPMRAYT